MTYQNDFTLPPDIMEQIVENGLDYLPELIRTVVNTAMTVERQGGDQFANIENRRPIARIRINGTQTGGWIPGSRTH
jgi:hypothetical protein